MRLFYAILFPNDFKAALAETMEMISKTQGGLKGNFTPADNLHLTLAFIGEREDITPAKEALNAVSFPPFELSLERLWIFKGSSLVYASLKKSPQCEKLTADIKAQLSIRGVDFDDKPFKPHITLIRKALGGLPEKTELPRASFMVHRVSLMDSSRISGRQVYRQIYYKNDNEE